MPSKLHHLGCESLCFLLSDHRKRVGVGVFLWNTSERQNRGFFSEINTFQKPERENIFAEIFRFFPWVPFQMDSNPL
mgnify:FL=1